MYTRASLERHYRRTRQRPSALGTNVQFPASCFFETRTDYSNLRVSSITNIQTDVNRDQQSPSQHTRTRKECKRAEKTTIITTGQIQIEDFEDTAVPAALGAAHRTRTFIVFCQSCYNFYGHHSPVIINSRGCTSGTKK